MLWDQVDMIRVGSPPDQVGISPAHWDGLRDDIVSALREWHAQRPDQPGPEETRLRRAITRRPSAALFSAAILDLLHGKRIARDGVYLTVPGHRAVFSAEDTALWDQIHALLEEGDIRPPRVLELAEATSLDRRTTERFLARAARAGLIHQVADNRFFLPESLLKLGKMAAVLATEVPDGIFSAGDFNKRSGIGRNLTISLLEFFDRKGLTHRSGNGRTVVTAPEKIFGN